MTPSAEGAGVNTTRQGGASGPLRLALVIGWRDLGRWLWAYLPEGKYRADLILATADTDADWSWRLPAFVRETWHLFRRRPALGGYDVVFAWELRTALAALLWRRLAGQRQSRLVVVAPIFKGPVARAVPLMRPLLADVDRFVCVSSAECDAYPSLLRLPPERFLFRPLAWQPDKGPEPSDEGYLLALGHSGRDYLTLLEAVRGTDIPVTIVSDNDRWLDGRPVPPNVTLLYRTGHHETIALIAAATFHVIPLHAADYAAGQSVLLRAMACGKAVVVSDIPGVRDYVRDGETALLVPVGDVDALRRTLLRLWADPDARARLGRSADRAVREEFNFASLTQYLAALAEELAA